MDRVAIMGWYGHNNIGDEAMLEGMKYMMRKYYKASEFDVLNGSEPLNEIINRINECDFFTLGGGELIHNDKLYLPYKGWEEAINIPKEIYGCGATSDELQPHVINSLQNFDAVHVRDKTTLKTLRKYKIPAFLCFDPSVALIIKYKLKHKPVKGRAVIIPTDRKDKKSDPGIIETNIIEKTKDKLKKQLLKDKIKQVDLIPFGEEDNCDIESCHEIVNSFGWNFPFLIEIN